MPPARRTPQDRKPKAIAPEPEPAHEFTFEVDRVTYSIPAPSEALALLPGRALRDALMDGEEGQMKLSFVCLEAVLTESAALDALYSLPAPDMMEIVGEWMTSADESGATVPQS